MKLSCLFFVAVTIHSDYIKDYQVLINQKVKN